MTNETEKPNTVNHITNESTDWSGPLFILAIAIALGVYYEVGISFEDVNGKEGYFLEYKNKGGEDD